MAAKIPARIGKVGRIRPTRRFIMLTLVSIVSVIVVGASAIAQVGGGSAAFNQGSRSGAEEARAHELAKRNVPFGEGRFIDASVLMNVKPDEYIAVFGISQEGETLDQ